MVRSTLRRRFASGRAADLPAAIFTDADRIQELRAAPGGQLTATAWRPGGAQAALQGEEWGS